MGKGGERLIKKKKQKNGFKDEVERSLRKGNKALRHHLAAGYSGVPFFIPDFLVRQLF